MAKPVDWNNVSMLTPGMKNLGNQFNKRWPNRDGTSDGAIGDYAHQQEDSGHNPDDTKYHNAEWDGDSDNKSEIRAIDVDNDLNDPEVSFQMVIDHMRRLPGLEKVIRYMIYNKKIYKASNNFNPETYTGSSSHTEHGHFSGAYSNSSDENKTFDFKFDELGGNMPTAQEVADAVWGKGFVGNDGKTVYPASTWLRNANIYAGNASNATDDIKAALATIASKVDLDPDELAAIKETLAIPTAEENAEAVLQALGGVDMGTLAQALRNALSDQQRADLVTALS